MPLSSYVPDWLASRAALSPQKVALVDVSTGQSFTYQQWNQQANQTAHFLQRLGLQRGERVAVLAPNSMAYLNIWFACNKTGLILQNLNWRLTATELGGLVADAEPAAFIYSSQFAETVQALQAQSPLVRQWLALDTPVRPDDMAFAEVTREATSPPPSIDLAQDDPWVICYTGGTTGLPKGAILTYRAIHTNAINTVMSWGLTPDDIAILNAPLFHTGGLNVFTAPLVQIGGTSLLCQGFDPAQTLDLIHTAGVTIFFGVPTMFAMLQQHPAWDSTDFSRLKIVISGGAPCPMEIFEKFWARDIDFKTGYGLTEAGPNTFWLPPEDVQRKPGAVGFPLLHIDVKIVTETGDTCGPDEVGQLLIRGEHMCNGYWNNPEATAAAIVAGWLHTGDLAVCDDEGYYTIVGRLKDMIISGGENIYPAEVESVLFGHPAVTAAAVLGLPDSKWGEIAVAAVVSTDLAVTEADLQAHCRTRLAGYKVPKAIHFVSELPLTGAGKIDKPVLQRQLLGD